MSTSSSMSSMVPKIDLANKANIVMIVVAVVALITFTLLMLFATNTIELPESAKNYVVVPLAFVFAFLTIGFILNVVTKVSSTSSSEESKKDV